MLRLIIVGIALVYGPAYACDCAWRGTPEEHIENSAVVVAGTNLEARVLNEAERAKIFPPKEGGPYIPDGIALARFEVQVAIKDAKKGDILSVYYDVEGTDCSMAPTVGDGRILLMDELYGKLFAFSCSNEWGSSEKNGRNILEYSKSVRDTAFQTIRLQTPVEPNPPWPRAVSSSSSTSSNAA